MFWRDKKDFKRILFQKINLGRIPSLSGLKEFFEELMNILKYKA